MLQQVRNVSFERKERTSACVRKGRQQIKGDRGGMFFFCFFFPKMKYPEACLYCETRNQSI